VLYALIYMKFKVNNMNVNVMLDSSATHTFVSNRLMGELGLQLSSSHITIKTMNVNA
jgi:predicted aspartyl protease